MKVTAILPDTLIDQVKAESGGRNITESLCIALNEWLSQRRIGHLNLEVRERPLEFRSGFNAEKVRQGSRRHGRR